MNDRVLRGFLVQQFEEGMALAQASDLFDLIPVGESGGEPPQNYMAIFHCKGLVSRGGGEIGECNHIEVAITFGSDYLRCADTYRVLTFLGPINFFHPNVSAPAICIGALEPASKLQDIIYRVFDVITYKKVTMREDNALNKAACVWARRNQHRFPVDDRPLKRRTLSLRTTPVGEANNP